MSSEQEEFFKGKLVRVLWHSELIMKVPPGKTPQAIWENINLSRLDKDPYVIRCTECIEKSETMMDDDTYKHIDPNKEV